MTTATNTKTPNDKGDADAQRRLILGILDRFAEDGAVLIDYLYHCGFDITTLARPSDLPAAWLGHYRIKNGVYDVDRACCDLSEWPPIASAIVKGLNAKQKLAK